MRHSDSGESVPTLPDLIAPGLDVVFVGNIHIAKMEKEVNEWLQTLGPDIAIKHVDNVSDRVSNNSTGGEDRRIMMMVWTGPK